MASGDFTHQAAELIQKRDFEGALCLLEPGLRAMPAGWRPVQESPDVLVVAPWDSAEFLCFCAQHQKSGSKKRVVWLRPSYSYAYCLLAEVRLQQGRMQEALAAIDQALALEPDHPQLLCWKGFFAYTVKRPADAVALYRRALQARPGWSPTPVVARALRQLAVALVELGRLDEAEAALRQSLTLEPANRLALSELDYIAKARSAPPRSG